MTNVLRLAAPAAPLTPVDSGQTPVNGFMPQHTHPRTTTHTPAAQLAASACLHFTHILTSSGSAPDPGRGCTSDPTHFHLSWQCVFENILHLHSLTPLPSYHARCPCAPAVTCNMQLINCVSLPHLGQTVGGYLNNLHPDMCRDMHR